ncbi:hypothetical protein N7490_004992 [Penicillium lividum]|nr:hypothetical protein N7490_004992 [Penicillium lividum]
MSGATNVATSVAELVNRKTPEALAILKKALEKYQASEDAPVAGSSKSSARHRRRRLVVARNQKEILEQIVQEGLPPNSRVGEATNQARGPKTPAKAKATAPCQPAGFADDKASFNAAIPDAAEGPGRKQSKGQRKRARIAAAKKLGRSIGVAETGTAKGAVEGAQTSVEREEVADLINFPMSQMAMDQPPEEE